MEKVSNIKSDAVSDEKGFIQVKKYPTDLMKINQLIKTQLSTNDPI